MDTFLKTRDTNDRCHASINPLRARTARMSITGIPAQTLPAGDSTIRRCFLADEGHSDRLCGLSKSGAPCPRCPFGR